jgi:hypothetical protein
MGITSHPTNFSAQDFYKTSLGLYYPTSRTKYATQFGIPELNRFLKEFYSLKT